ncbi:MAG: L-rhamnonate dehydratase [Thermaerobacter sp.]|nr:L-rhamnonate dehydratase [Thermaerobacter sp.]
MRGERIRAVRALTARGGGADYHDQGASHWIVGQVATPMSCYPAYRDTRSSWGIDALGTVVVEVEDEAGRVGIGVSTGGVPAAWLVAHHLDRFAVGRDPSQVELIWDQMYRSSLYYGRKGLALNAISAVDLALWDLWGRQRQEPVFHLLGGPVRRNLPCYATGPRPDWAVAAGFLGGKLPLVHGPDEGMVGLRKNLDTVARARDQMGPDALLMVDCWMALDLNYAEQLVAGLAPLGVYWVEECFPPDDYWSYRELRRRRPLGMRIATGEHEATRWGFRLLLEMEAADVIQPDVTWCGGLTELTRIAALADSWQVPVIPHGSSVYSYHFAAARAATPFSEFLMMHPTATGLTPMFDPLLLGEPLPVDGVITVPDTPGFGVELNRSLDLMPAP